MPSTCGVACSNLGLANWERLGLLQAVPCWEAGEGCGWHAGKGHVRLLQVGTGVSMHVSTPNNKPTQPTRQKGNKKAGMPGTTAWGRRCLGKNLSGCGKNVWEGMPLP